MSIPPVPTNDIEWLEKVGEGAYGQVWKAKWNGNGGGISVAIKRVKLTIIPPAQRSKILDEVDILSKLRHPNIVQIYGACLLGKELLIMMEFVDGGTLYEKLQSGFPIPWDVRLRLAHLAAICVNVLHTREPAVLHRDIKSLNFLVSKDLSSVKLIDFGLSKFTDVVSANPRGPGTLRWAAPETLKENIHWTVKADIYSLGLTFYEIATSKLPFEGLDVERVRLVVSNGARPDLPEECPKEFATIIRECWDSTPEIRPDSQELVARLAAMAGSIEQESKPESKEFVKAPYMSPSSRSSAPHRIARNSLASTSFPSSFSILPLGLEAPPKPIILENVTSPRRNSELFSRGLDSGYRRGTIPSLDVAPDRVVLKTGRTPEGVEDKRLTLTKQLSFPVAAKRGKNAPKLRLCSPWRETLYGGTEVILTELPKAQTFQHDHPALNLNVGLSIDGTASFKAKDGWHMSVAPSPFSIATPKLFRADGLQLLSTDFGGIGLSFNTAFSRHFFVCFKTPGSKFYLQLKYTDESNVTYNGDKHFIFIPNADGKIRLVYSSPILRLASNKTTYAPLQWDAKKRRIKIRLPDQGFPIVIAFGVSTQIPESTFGPFPLFKLGDSGELEHGECSSESEGEEPKVTRYRDSKGNGGAFTHFVTSFFKHPATLASHANELQYYNFSLPSLGHLTQFLWDKPPSVVLAKGERASLHHNSFLVYLHLDGSAEFRHSNGSTIKVSPVSPLGPDTSVFSGTGSILLKSGPFEAGIVVKGTLRQFFVLPFGNTFTLRFQLQGGMIEFDKSHSLTLLDNTLRKVLTFHKPLVTDSQKNRFEVAWSFTTTDLVITLPDKFEPPLILVFFIYCPGEAFLTGYEREGIKARESTTP